MTSRRRGAASVAKRGVWSVADQVISASSNVLLTVAVARTVSEREFGAFAIGLALLRVVLSVNRAVTADLVVIRGSGSSTATWRRVTAEALGQTAVIGLAGSIVGVGLAIVVGADLRPMMFASAAVLPMVLLQDTWRYAVTARRRADVAAAGDGLWLVTFVAAIPLASTWGLGAAGLTLLWGILGGVTVAIWMMRDELRVRPIDGLRVLSSSRGISLRFLAEHLIVQAGAQGAAVGTGMLAGVSAAGAIRGAETIFGPATVAVVGLRVFGMQAGSEVRDQAHRVLIRQMRTTSVIGAAVAAVSLCVALVLPDDVGRSILGESWESTQQVLLPAGIGVVGMAVAGGALAGLRALAASRRSLRVRALQAPAFLAAATVGPALDGARGAMIALAAAYWIGAGASWVQLRRSQVDDPSQTIQNLVDGSS